MDATQRANLCQVSGIWLASCPLVSPGAVPEKGVTGRRTGSYENRAGKYLLYIVIVIEVRLTASSTAS